MFFSYSYISYTIIHDGFPHASATICPSANKVIWTMDNIDSNNSTSKGSKTLAVCTIIAICYKLFVDYS